MLTIIEYQPMAAVGASSFLRIIAAAPSMLSREKNSPVFLARRRGTIEKPITFDQSPRSFLKVYPDLP